MEKGAEIQRLFCIANFLWFYLFTPRKTTLHFYCQPVRFTLNSHPVSY